ncbi:antitermination protein [Salmonella enterica]|nr:antitermination protein [Salmonella enterica]EBL5124835.1 antitermination protein [Salmonella enterica subsp. enterica serovar Rubislaw]EDV3147931.1 antitermination protein [Salmonella enterica subsp. enterica serovar Chandans]EEE3048843.1 antitermination protein [Salmonella enterica subsp. enterica serovar Duisburg]EAQ9952174.1 antitermination protein [Salmonella enterica]
MRDIQQVLERWGAWAASEGGSVYYHPVAAGFKGLFPIRRRCRVSCSDSDGLIVSSAVNRLKKKDSYLHTLIEMYYVNRMSLRTVAGRLGVSLNQVVIRLQTAEGFIDGCLMALDVRLEMDRECQKENIYVSGEKKGCVITKRRLP